MKSKNYISKFIITGGMICFLGTFLVACAGSEASSNDFVGHWNVKSLEAGGESIDIEALYSLIGQEETASVGLDLEKDGTALLNVYADEETTQGTWKSTGKDTIIITMEGSEQTASMKDGILVMNYSDGDEDISISFTK